jgi:hypothetical protein
MSTAFKAIALSVMCLFMPARHFAQGTFGTFLRSSGSFLPAGVPGHHIDQFSVQSSVGIRTLEAYVLISPMNQVQVGGEPTVFSTLLLPADLDSDSHFVFDISNATILSQFEDSTQIRASVEFNADFPTSFVLARVVGADLHSFYEAGISGRLVTGEPFFSSIVFVPEPSASFFASFGLLWFLISFVRKSKS